MKIRGLAVLMALLCVGAPVHAQQGPVTGTVTDEQGAPLSGVSVVIKGTNTGTVTNNAGAYTIRASTGQTLAFKFIGTVPVERLIGSDHTINVQLRRVAVSLDAIVTTALGQTASQRELG